jgi:hypothetical protein
MKKLVLTAMALAVGATLGYSQGAVVLATTSGLVSTNGGNGSVVAGGATGTYYYELLDMTSTAYGSLSGSQQANATNLSLSLGLWTDSTVGGNNTSLHAGGIGGGASTAGNVANNWAQPLPSQTYSTASSYDYYVIVGWSANEGTSWSVISNDLAGATSWAVTGAGSWYGVSAVGDNYAGVSGGSPAPPSVWGPAGPATTSFGSAPTGLVLTPISPVPEPSTMALAGLGGLSMLLFRRKK